MAIADFELLLQTVQLKWTLGAEMYCLSSVRRGRLSTDSQVD